MSLRKTAATTVVASPSRGTAFTMPTSFTSYTIPNGGGGGSGGKHHQFAASFIPSPNGLQVGLEYSSPRAGTQNYPRDNNATFAPPWGPVTPMLATERDRKAPTMGEKISVGSGSSVGGRTAKRRWSAIGRQDAHRGVVGAKLGGVGEAAEGGRWGGEWGSSVDFRLHQHVERFVRRGAGSIADARQLAQLLQVSFATVESDACFEVKHFITDDALQLRTYPNMCAFHDILRSQQVPSPWDCLLGLTYTFVKVDCWVVM